MHRLHRLQQHLSKPTHAYTFIGRYQIGKSTLLRHFQQAAGDETIAVYIPLRQIPVTSETLWLTSMAEIAVETVHQLGYKPISLPLTDDDTARRWLAEGFLPSLFRAIHARRKLVLLLDDAEQLLQAVEAGHLPDDTFEYLNSLIGEQLGIVLTVSVDYEDRLKDFAPLVDPDAVERLSNLPLNAILKRVNGDDATAQAIYEATGGEPWLVSAFIQRFSDEPDQKMNALADRIYQEAESQFHVIWRGLTGDERLVLTAISGLLYNDPTRPTTVERIEQWLVETDYPLDRTTINAAVRGLEYRELVRASSGDIRVASSLMRRWLLKNAHLSGAAFPSSQDMTSPAPEAGRLMLVALVIVIVALGLVAAAVLSQSPGDSTPAETLPTVTLIPDTEP